ncbi:hypothetical protein F4803DRAFT_562077 [Xylaria telfairii]|nr:hypothetical protein F4803DRAFT_562077 [Xylaria telfairii]
MLPGTATLEDITEEHFATNALNDAVLNDEEEVMHIAEQVAIYAQHSALGRQKFDTEKKRGILKKRTNQATIHTAFTEFRIQDLEEQLRQVRIDLYKLPKHTGIYEEPEVQHPIFLHVLQHPSPDKFELRRDMLKTPLKDRPALEALVIEELAGSGSRPESIPLLGETIGLSSTYLTPKSLRIRPRMLIAHLQQVTHTNISAVLSPPMEDDEQDSIVFLRPFKLFIKHEEVIRQSLRDLEAKAHDLPLLQEAVSQPENSQKAYNDEDLLLDLRLLVKFMDEDMHPTFDLCRRIKDGTATEIEYQDLWHLFKCGDIILAQSDRSHAYKVLSFTGGRDLLVDRLDQERDILPMAVGFMIDCLSIRFDGINYIPQLHSFSIRPFPGRQRITSLPIYPLRFDEDREGLQLDMIAQGRRYLDVTTSPQSHKHLVGRTLDEPAHDIDAQVIIDERMALSSVPEWRPKKRYINRDQFAKADHRETFCRPSCSHMNRLGVNEGCCGSDIAFKDHNNQHILNPRPVDDLDYEDLMLLPCEIHGFVLRNRQWITLRVADLSEQHKSAIQALVKVHENAATKQGNSTRTIGNSIDLVKGKGTGLILLLHGEPGVGKTSTAECVADHAKRPLFPITCGDIGETATEVERNLHHNFGMAHKWGCVLLLDEADVFLAKRNKTDLRRNAVTSVFLRSLEYYAGILFLTTNRVGSIDPAFKSRIHISLFYPKFDLEATLRLYSTYLKRAKLEQERLQSATFKIKEKEILKFAKRHFRQSEKEGLGTWNGRQIRNAFQAAIALVEYDSQQTKDGCPRPTLGEAQFRVVADSSREFDRYLVSTLGAADSDIARREEWRFDRFGNLGPKQPATSQGHYLKKPGFYGEKRDKTEDDDDDTSSDGDDSSDENDSDNNSIAQRHSGKRAGVMSTNDDMDQDDAEEFQEYLEWKRARKSDKGRR